MKTKLIYLKDFLFPNAKVLKKLCFVNVKRLINISIVLIGFHLSISAMFWFQLGGHENFLWHKGIFYSHVFGFFLVILALLSGIFINYKQNLDPRVSLLLISIVIFLYMNLASTIASLDQIISTNITSFIITYLSISIIYIFPPSLTLVIFPAGYFCFYEIIGIYQTNQEILLSHRINALGIIIVSITLSIIFYTNFRTKIKQENIILSQKKDLERKNLELIRLNQAKSDFLSIAAHDLKNPLGVIQGMSSLLLESDNLSTEAHEKVYSIMQSAKRMFYLVNDLLNINRIESDKIQINWEICNLNTILEEGVKVMSPFATKKNQKIITQFSSEKLLILVDKLYLSGIIENLLSNAIKYSDFNKSIYVRTFKEKSFCYLEIQDQGPGLSQEEQKKLFQKFTKLTPKPTGNEHSSGLGLFIVKKLTELMNGNVVCISEKGVGSTFLVLFPEVIVSQTRENISRDNLVKKLKSYTILVVDDDLANRNLLKLFLKNLGNQPFLVSSGQEAIELIQNQKIDLVFLDMDMPDLNGIQTKNKIEELGYSPIFVLSSASTTEISSAKELGFSYVLEKPFTHDKFIEVLEKICFK
jgi:signal transduction histidine kinase